MLELAVEDVSAAGSGCEWVRSIPGARKEGRLSYAAEGKGIVVGQ